MITTTSSSSKANGGVIAHERGGSRVRYRSIGRSVGCRRVRSTDAYQHDVDSHVHEVRAATNERPGASRYLLSSVPSMSSLDTRALISSHITGDVGGSIVNCGSIAGLVTAVRFAGGYGASKAAISAITRVRYEYSVDVLVDSRC